MTASPAHRQQADVVVVGGGLAGLSAAARAAEGGAAVRVLEQGEEDAYPCNSRYAGGMMHLAFQDARVEPEALGARLRTICPPDLDPDLLDIIGRNARETFRWLAATGGARFIRAGPAHWQTHCLAPVRPRRPGLVWPGRGTHRVLRGLEAALNARGGGLERGSTVSAVEPLRDGGYAVRYTRDGVAQTLPARAVVVCDGGFQADLELVRTRLAPAPDAVLQRNAGTGRGLAMRLAADLGLALAPVDRFYGHLVAAKAMHDPKLWPWPTVDELMMAGILVDRTGARFLDEGLGGVYAANMLAGAPQAGDAYVLVDDKAWREVGPTTRVVPCNPFLERLGAEIFRADTVEAVAAQAGIAPEALANTVRRVNEAAGTGTLSPPRSAGPNGSRMLAAAPYRLIPVRAGITYTMSGLLVDGDATVRGTSGSRREGLFAAGASVGGAEGGQTAFYLGGLCKAAILGRIAGESAAAFATSRGGAKASS